MRISHFVDNAQDFNDVLLSSLQREGRGGRGGGGGGVGREEIRGERG